MLARRRRRGVLGGAVALVVGAFLLLSAGPAAAATISGTLSSTDQSSPHRTRCDTYTVSGVTAGTSVQVRHRGSTGGFGTLGDPYLYIFNSSGGVVARNDDSGGTLNSLITITWQTGYYIGAAAYSSGLGSYQVYTSVGSLAASSLSCSGTVAKQNQTITFTNPGTRQYRPTFTVSATASSGLTVGLTSNTTGICTVSGFTVTPQSVGTCTITASQGGNATFNAASNVSQSFTITKADQSITFGALSNRPYSPTAFAVSATASSGLTPTFSSLTTSVCTVSGSNVTMLAEGTCTIRSSQSGNTLWNAATDVDRSFAISKASQTITFTNPGAKAFSATPFTVAPTSSSGLTVTVTSRTTGVCTVSGFSVTMVSVGTCTLQASQAGNTQYLPAVNVEQSFSVSKTNQTITFGSLSGKTYGDSVFSVSATATSGLSVAFTSSTTATCTVSGATVSIVSAGTCTIAANQAGDSLYNAAPAVSQSFTVARKTVTASATLASRPYNGSRSAGALTLGSLVGLVPGESLILSATASDYASASVGTRSSTITYTLSDGSGGGRAANYSISSVTVNGEITQRPLTVTATSISRRTDAASPTFAVTTSGLVPGESVSSATYTFLGTGSTTYASSTTAPNATTVGTYQVTPSALVLTSPATASNYEITYVAGTYNVTIGAASQLVRNTATLSGASGSTFSTQPVITIQDAGDNTVTTGADSSQVVTATVSGDGTLIGTRTATAFEGVARFVNLGITGSSSTTYTITYTATLNGVSRSVTQTVQPTFGAASSLRIRTNAATARAGVAFGTQPVVEIVDSVGNVVTSSSARVSLTVSDGGTLSGTTTVTASSGVATFSGVGLAGTVTTNGSPVYALTFAASGLTSVTQSNLSLSAGVAARLSLSDGVSGSESGAVFSTQPKVTVLDAYGNAVTQANNTVTATLTQVNSTGTLVGGLPGQSNVSSAGLQARFMRGSLSAIRATKGVAITTATSGYCLGGSVANLNYSWGSGGPGGTCGSDRFAGYWSGYITSPVSKTVTFNVSVDDGFYMTINDTAVVNSWVDQGSATYNASGTFAMTANTEYPIKIWFYENAGGAAARLFWNANAGNTTEVVPTSAFAGAPGPSLTATANTASSGQATFSGLGVNGLIGTTYTITYSATVDGQVLTTTRQDVLITSGLPRSIRIDRAPAGAVNGSALTTQPIVTLLDSAGNPITLASGKTITVTASIPDLTAAGNTATVTSTSNGQATFSGLTFTGTSGTKTLTFAATASTDTNVQAAITANSVSSVASAVTLNPGPAVGLAIRTNSSTSVASGATLSTQPVIAVVDASGNTVTTSNATVTASIADGPAGGVLLGTAARQAVAGAVTYSGLGIRGTAGTYQLSFAGNVDADADVESVLQSDAAGSDERIAVTYGAAAKLVLANSMSGVTAASGAAFSTQPIVQVQDSAGNVVANSTASITTSVSTGATLVGTATANAASGERTFSGLGINGTNLTTYTMTYSSSGLTSVTHTVQATTGAATKIALTTPAVGNQAGQAFTTQPRISVLDSANNVVTTSSAQVTTTVSSGGTLVGTTTATAGAGATPGVAEFADLGISGTAGTTYTVTYSSGSLATLTQSIVVRAGPAAALAITTESSTSVASGSAFVRQPVVRVVDIAGNVVTTSTDLVTATIVAGSPDGALVGTAARYPTNGVVTFTGLGIRGVAGAYTLRYTSGSLTAATQVSTVAVTHGAASKVVVTNKSAVEAATTGSGAKLTVPPIVQIQDVSGNEVTSGTGRTANTSISVSGSDGLTISGGATCAMGGDCQVGDIGPAGGRIIYVAPSNQSWGRYIEAAPTGWYGTSNDPTASYGCDTTYVTGAVATGIGDGASNTAAILAACSTSGIAARLADSYSVTNRGVVYDDWFLGSRDENRQVYENQSVFASGTLPDYLWNSNNSGTWTAQMTNFLVYGLEGTNNKNDLLAVRPLRYVAAGSGISVTGTAGRTYTLTYSASVGGTTLTPATHAVTVSVGTPTKLALNRASVGTASGAAFTTQPWISILDSGNNLVTTATNEVTATISTGSLVGTTSATPTGSSGIAKFADLGISGTAGTAHTITYSATGLTSVTQSVTPSFGSPSQLVVTTTPDALANGTAGNVRAGLAFGRQPVVEIRDGAGNKVTTSTARVTATINTGSLVGGTIADAVAGVATFANLGASGTVGSGYTVTFTASLGGSSRTVTTNLAMVAGTASYLAIDRSAAAEVSGVRTVNAGVVIPSSNQPIISFRDLAGNVVSDAAAPTVTVSVSGGVTVDSGQVSASDGTVEFGNLKLTGVTGSYTLTYSSPGVTPVSQAIAVAPGAPTKIVVDPSAKEFVAASASTVNFAGAVKVTDAAGNVVDVDGSLTVAASYEELTTPTDACAAGAVSTRTVGSYTVVTIDRNAGTDGTNGCKWKVPLGVSALRVAVVGGGGGGGRDGGTGGGGGELRQSTTDHSDDSSKVGAIAVAEGTEVSIVVGAGGVGGVHVAESGGLPTRDASAGGATTVSWTGRSFTANGGQPGLNWGSGTVRAGVAGGTAGSGGYGQDGGQSGDSPNQQCTGWGVGTDGRTGPRISSALFGTTTGFGDSNGYFGGGGGGGIQVATPTYGTAFDGPSGGVGGGGRGSNYYVRGTGNGTDQGQPGTDGFGGGGGGSSACGDGNSNSQTYGARTNAGDGGDGVVILAYETSAADVALKVKTSDTATAATLTSTSATLTDGSLALSSLRLDGQSRTYTLTYSGSVTYNGQSVTLTSDTQTVEVTPGTPSVLEVTTDPAGAASGAAFNVQPTVAIRDASGNLVTGEPQYTVRSALVTPQTSTLGGTTSTLSVDGVVTNSDLSLTGTAGDHRVAVTAAASDGLLMHFDAHASYVAGQADTWFDISGNGRNATISNSPTHTARSGNTPASLLFEDPSAATPKHAQLTDTLADVSFANGLTIQSRVKFNDVFGDDPNTPDTEQADIRHWSRIVDFGNGAATNNIFLTREGYSRHLVLHVYSNAGINICRANDIVPVTPAFHDYAVRLSVSGSTVSCAYFRDGVNWVSYPGNNSSSVTNELTTTAELPPTLARANNYIARSNWGSVDTHSMNMSSLLMYNRGLDDAAINANAIGSDYYTVSLVAGTPTKVAAPSAASVAAGARIAGANATIQDASSNAITTSASSVSVAITAGPDGYLTSASLNGTTTRSAVDGIAEFNDLSLSGPAGTYTLTYSSGGLTAGTQTVTLAAGTPTTLVLTTTAPTSVASGATFASGEQPRIEIRDGYGNVTTSGASVSATLTRVELDGSPTGVLVGGTTTTAKSVTALSGVATFSGLGITGTKDQTYRLTFSSSGLSDVTMDVAVTAGAATQLAIVREAGDARVGLNVGVAPIIELRDSGNNPVESSGVRISTMVSTGATVTTAGSFDDTGAAGQVTLSDLTFGGTASEDGDTYTVTYAATDLASVTQSLTLRTGNVAGLTVNRGAGNVAKSGSAFTQSATVTLGDPSNNAITQAAGLVTATVTTGSGTLLGSAVKPLVAGVATFDDLGLEGTAGDYTVTYSATFLGVSYTIEEDIPLVAGDPVRVALTTEAGGTAVGAAFSPQPKLTFTDRSGNTATSTDYVQVSVEQIDVDGALTGTLLGTTLRQATAGVVDFGATPSAGITLVGKVGQTYRLTYTVVDAQGDANAAYSPIVQSVTVTPGTATSLVLTTEAAGAVNGSALTTQPRLELRDVGGNVASTTSGTVTMTVTNGPTGYADVLGCSSGTGCDTKLLSSGVASFANLKMTGLVGTYEINYAVGGLTATQQIEVSPGAATKLVVGTAPAGAASGSAFTTQPVVRVTDASGNVVASASTTVTVTSNKGSLIGATSIPTVAGIATFDGLGISGLTTENPHLLTFSSNGDTYTAATSSLTLTAGPAARLSVSAPSTAQAGVAFGTQPQVSVLDAGGNVVTTSAAEVTATISAGADLYGTSSPIVSDGVAATASSGVASFSDLAIYGASGSSYTVTFSTDGLASVSQTVSLSTGPLAQLGLTQSAAGARAGVQLDTMPVVQLLDAAGNPISTSGVSVTAEITPIDVDGQSTGSLDGTVTVATDAAGLATFTDLKVNGALGLEYTLTYSVTTAGVTSASQTIVTQVGPASKLAFARQPSSGVASGAALSTQPIVQIQDAAGNPLPSSEAPVAVSVQRKLVDGATTTLVAGGSVSYTAPSTTGGLATFTDLSVSGVSGASYRLSFTSDGLTAATFDVSMSTGAATTLAITTNTGAGFTAPAGNAFSSDIVVAVRDSGGNVVNSDAEVAATISCNSDDAVTCSGATLTGDVTATASGGIATFESLGVTGTSGQVPTVTFSVPGLASASFSPTISAGSAARLTVVTSGATAPSGTSFGTAPQVAIEDAGGNRITTGPTSSLEINATVTQVSVGGSATGVLVTSSGDSATTSLTATASAGLATFTNLGLTGVKDVAYTITYSASATSGGGSISLSGTESLTVSTGPAVALALTTESVGSASGAAFTTQPVVTLRDSGGNTVTGSTDSVTATIALTSGADGGSLVGTSRVALSSGVATFTNLGLTGTSGTSYRITYTLTNGSGTAIAGVATTSQDVTATVGAAASIALTTSVADAVSGLAFGTQPVVTVRDSGGNTVTSSTMDVTVTLTAGADGGLVSGGTAPASVTVAAVDGVASFSQLGITGVVSQSYSLTFTAASLSGAGRAVTQAGIAVAPGAASEFGVSTGAGVQAPSGSAFTIQPNITILDAQGNTVTSSTARVTAAITQVGGTGELVGTTFADAVSGVATFANLGITGSAGQAYTVTFSVAGLADETAAYTVSTGPATQLALTRQSEGTTAGAAFTTQPQVTVRDSGGNTVTTYSTAITATITRRTVDGNLTGELVGTTTATPTTGVATFGSVGIGGIAGVAYTITYGSGDLASATQVVTPTAGPPSRLALTRSSSGTVAGREFTVQPRLRVLDAYGNTVTTSSDVVTATVSQGGTLIGTTARSAAEGIVAYTNLGVRGTANTTYTMSYALAGFAPTTESVTLTAGAAYRLTLRTLAAGATSGSAFTTQPVLEVKDSSGNLVTASTATVTATVTQLLGSGTLTGTTTATASGGVVTFGDLGLNGLAGTSYLVTFSSTGLLPEQQTILLGVGAPATLSLIQQSVGTASGAAFVVQPRVAILDAGGNIVTTSSEAILASITQVSVGGELTGALVGTASQAATSGIATFTNLGISGRNTTAYTVSYSVPSLPALSAVTQTITPTTGAAASLRLTTAAKLTSSSTDSIVVSGAVFGVQPQITVVDSGGNRVTSFNDAVTAGVTGAGGSLVGTRSRNAISGIVTYTDLGLAGTTGTTYTVSFGATDASSVAQELEVISSLPGSVPAFSTPVSTEDGMRVTITNHDPTFTYDAVTSVGARAVVGTTGVVLVTGVQADSMFTLIVSTSKTNHRTESASVLGRSLPGLGLIPVVGTATATADGFSAQITNYSTEYSWTVTASAGRGAISSTGLLTVSGANPDTSVTVTIATARLGHTSRSFTTAAVTTLSRALTPTFAPTTRTEGGFTTAITNFDPDYTYAATVSSGGTVSLDNATGAITVSGLSDGTLATVLVVTSRATYANGSGAVQGQALSTALTPLLADPVAITTGFTVDINNYDAAFTWTPSVSSGSVTLAATSATTGRATVTLANGVDATLTVATSRTGYRTSSATRDLAWTEGLRAVFGSASSTTTGFTVPVTNHSADYTWSVSATSGTATISNSGVVTVTGMTGATSTVTVSTRRNGYSSLGSTFTYATTPGLVATFGSPTSTSDGFTVSITNHDAAYTWSGTATQGGTVSVDGSGLVTVTGLQPGTTSTVSVLTNRSGYSTGVATVTGSSSNAAALTPTFGSVTRTEGGYTVDVTNFDADYRWSAEVTAGDTDGIAVVDEGALTVSGVAPGQSATVTVTAQRSGYDTGTATVSGTALTGGSLIPVFGRSSANSTGFSVPISNYDADFTWSATATGGASASVSAGAVTVSGLSDGQSSTVTVTATRSGRADGSSSFTGAALTGSSNTLTAALVPVFGTPTGTADGFRVRITNYDSSYTWAGVTSRNATVTIAAGIATVSGIAAGRTDTLYVTTNKSGSATGSAAVTGTALATGARPANLLSAGTVGTLCSTSSPGGEGVTSVNDLSATTKFSCLHAASGEVTSYTPNSAGFYTGNLGSYVLTSVTFTSAADAPDRDPLTFTLWGCAQQNANCSIIVSDARTELSTTRGEDKEVALRNTRAFAFYKLTFGSVRSTSNAMQVADVSFAGSSGLLSGLVPTFGTQTPDTTRATVPITNFSALYDWSLSVTDGARASLDRNTGTVTVANVAPSSTVTLSVTTRRDGYSTETATIPVTTTSGAALVPMLSTVRATTTGASARIENYDTPGFTWSAETTSAGVAVGTTTIGTDGFVRVTGVPAGTEITITVTTTRENYSTGTNYVETTVLSPAYVATFATPTRTGDGFTVQIVDYDDAVDDYEWTFAATAGGQVSVSDTGLVTVSNLGPGVTSTLTVTTRGANLAPASAMLVETSIAPARVPLFDAPAARTDATGFESLITNYDAAFTWTASASAGTVDIVVEGSSATVVATDSTATVTVTAARTGYVTGTATLRNTMAEALEPEFDAPIVSASGFTVQISNYDAVAANWSAFLTPAGTVTINGSGLVTASGVPVGAEAVLTVRTSFTGRHSGSATTTVNLTRATALTPAFASPLPFGGGFTVQVSNYSPDFSWTVAASSGAAASIDSEGLITVTGVSNAESTTLTVTTAREGYATGTATTTGSSRLSTALTPTLGVPEPTADGFTVEIVNFDADYTWTGQVDNNGSISISEDGIVTVSGVPGFTEATATITASRTGFASGTSTVAATSTAGSALVPQFGVSTSSATGYTVPLRNYDSRYTWTVTPGTTSGVSATIDASGVITVDMSGLSANAADYAGRLETVTVRTTRTGFLDGAADFTAAARSQQSTAVTAFSVTSYEVSAGTATLTTSTTHGFAVNNEVFISGVATGIDGVQTVTSVNAGARTFSFAVSADDSTSTSLSPTGTVRRSGDFSVDVTLNPVRSANDTRPDVGATINIPYSVAGDGTSFVGIPSMTEEADAGYRVVTVRATSPDGANVSELQDAIRILFDPGATNAVPVTSSDNGLTWEELPQLTSALLPAGERHGYYRADDGTIWIYSRHLTMFGMLAPQAVPVTVTAAAAQINVGVSTTATYSGGEGVGSLTIASSTPSVCSVTQAGVVTGLSAGTCTLTATRVASGRFLDATGSTSLRVGSTTSDSVPAVDAGAQTTPTTVPPADVPSETPPVTTPITAPPTTVPFERDNPLDDLQRRIEVAQESVAVPVELELVGRFVPDRPAVVILEGGRAVAAIIVRTTNGNGFTIAAPDFSITVEAFKADGTPAEIDTTGRVVIEQTGTMRVIGEGFAPNTKVKVWIFSEPTEAAELLSDEDGRIDAIVAMPTELALGQHTVQLNGVSPRGDVRSINVGVMLVPSTVTDVEDAPEVISAEVDSKNRAGVGTALTAVAAVAALVGMAVLALAIARRPRRRTPQS